MIKFECCHADTCLPDYWSGHHLPHVQIPVYRDMSLAQIKSELHSELQCGYISGNSDDARDMNDSYRCDHARTEALRKAAHDAIDAIELRDPENDHCFMDLEESTDDDDGESVYAFFVFVKLED